MRILFTFLLILSVCVSFVFAQEKSDWIRIESEGKDISFVVPSNFLFDKSEGTIKIYGFQTNISIRIEIESTKNAIGKFKSRFSLLNDKDSYKFFAFEKSQIAHFQRNDDKKQVFQDYITIATEKGFYTLSIISQEKKDENYQKFLGSIQINNVPIFTNTTKFPTEIEKTSVTSLNNSAEILQAVKQKDSKKKKLDYSAIPTELEASNFKNLSRDLILLRKPSASFSSSARERRISGKVRLIVEFLADGQIGEVKIVESLDRDLDQNSFDAVKKIKFLPAQRNGQNISIMKFLEYHFSSY